VNATRLHPLKLEKLNVKEVRNCRPVERNVRVTVRRDWIREIVTAAVADGADLPVSLDEFIDRNVVWVAMSDVTTFEYCETTSSGMRVPPPKKSSG